MEKLDKKFDDFQLVMHDEINQMFPNKNKSTTNIPQQNPYGRRATG